MGFLRFVLAFFVVTQHIMGVSYLGAAAVHVFFLISGYLMTRVMLETYGYSRLGFARFWTNRILRLLPTYLVVATITVPVLHYIGEDFGRRLVTSIGVPMTLASWLQNLTMLYADVIPNSVVPRLVPPTWALTLELISYFLISLGITRSGGVSLVWLLCSIIFSVIALFLAENPGRWLYSSVPAAFLPFSIGALIFHAQHKKGDANFKSYQSISDHMKWSRRLKLSQHSALLLLCLGVMVVLVLIRHALAGLLDLQLAAIFVFMLNIVPGSIALVASLNWQIETSRARRLDQLAGDLSYPIYISHFLIAIGMSWVFQSLGGELLFRGPVLMSITFVPLVIFSYVLVRFVDLPITQVRGRVRDAAKENQL